MTDLAAPTTPGEDGPTMEIGCPHSAWGMVVSCPHCGSPRIVAPAETLDVTIEALSVALHEAGIGCSIEPCDYRTEFYEGVARTMHDTDARELLARLSSGGEDTPA